MDHESDKAKIELLAQIYKIQRISFQYSLDISWLRFSAIIESFVAILCWSLTLKTYLLGYAWGYIAVFIAISVLYNLWLIVDLKSKIYRVNQLKSERQSLIKIIEEYAERLNGD